MRICGREYSRDELEKRIPDMQKVFGPRFYELEEGAQRGTRAADIDTGLLHFCIVLDRGMDISLTKYKGFNITHLTENGEIHPSFYESKGNEWARILFGGMVTTCGLTNLGPPGKDKNEDLGLHGRYSALPARRIRNDSGWNENEYDIILEGQMDETVQMGYKIRLNRKISCRAGTAEIHIQDVVSNVGTCDTPFNILYHINFGFPFLDKKTRLLVQSGECIPFDEYSRIKIAERFEMEAPQAGVKEQNYLYPVIQDEDKNGLALVINDRVGFGVYIQTSGDTLPYFCEWKMMDERDYVLAVEPSNVPCENRKVLREKGLLPILQPGDSRTMSLKIGVAEGKELERLEKRIQLICAKWKKKKE